VVVVRTLRTRALRASTLSTVDVTLHRDDGALARLVGRLGARAGVRVPPLPSAGLAALAGLVLLGVVAGAPGGGVGAAARAGCVVATDVCLCVAALAGRQPHDGGLDWFVPAALRAAELTVIVAVAVAGGVPLPVLYALVAVLALFHYDLAARVNRASSPLVARALGLGWDGRLLVLAVAGVGGVAVPVFVVLVGWLAAVFVAGATVGALRARRRGGDRVPLPPRQRTGTPATEVHAASGPGPSARSPSSADQGLRAMD
jgi:hypothetical protein